MSWKHTEVWHTASDTTVTDKIQTLVVAARKITDIWARTSESKSFDLDQVVSLQGSNYACIHACHAQI